MEYACRVPAHSSSAAVFSLSAGDNLFTIPKTSALARKGTTSKQPFPRTAAPTGLASALPSGLHRCCQDSVSSLKLGRSNTRRCLVRQAAGPRDEQSVEGKGTGSLVDDQGGSAKSVKERLALLELYTSGSDDEDGPASEEGTPSMSGEDKNPTVAERLRQQYKVVVSEEVVLPLGPRKLVRRSAKPVTLAQQRNLRRATYLEEVSQRNDSGFYSAVAASVLLPPILILAAAWGTGYLELLN